MANLPAWYLRDFRQGRITPETISNVLVPENSVKDSQNINFDEVVGFAKVRAGTTDLGESVTDPDFTPQGLAEFVPAEGANVGIELVTNGSFTGNADGWVLGTQWTYNSNNVIFTP